MTSSNAQDRPPDVPPAIWAWLGAQLPQGTSHLLRDPLVAVVNAAAPSARRDSGPLSDDVLRGWSYLLDDRRRSLSQSKRVFIEEARAAGWADDQVCEALLLDDDVDLADRLDALNDMVFQRDRPPVS
jgi:hypothetical protein